MYKVQIVHRAFLNQFLKTNPTQPKLSFYLIGKCWVWYLYFWSFFGARANHRPGFRNINPGYPDIYPGYPHIYPGNPDIYPGYPDIYPGYPDIYPGYPDIYSGYSDIYPGYPDIYPGYPDIYPGYPDIYPGYPSYPSYPDFNIRSYPDTLIHAWYPDTSNHQLSGLSGLSRLSGFIHIPYCLT